MKYKKILATSLSLGLVFAGATQVYASEDYIEEANNNVLSTSNGGQGLEKAWNKEDLEETNKLEINPKYVADNTQRLGASRESRIIGEDNKGNKAESSADKTKKNNNEGKKPVIIEKPATNDNKNQDPTSEAGSKGDSTNNNGNEGKEPVIIDKETSDDNKGNENPSSTADGSQISDESGLTNGAKGQAYPKGTTIEITKVSNNKKEEKKANTEAGANPKTGIFASSSVIGVLVAASVAYTGSKRK